MSKKLLVKPSGREKSQNNVIMYATAICGRIFITALCASTPTAYCGRYDTKDRFLPWM